MPAGPLDVIDNFSKDFFSWGVAIFSNSSKLTLTDRIYRCYSRLLFVLFFFFYDGGPAGPLVDVRFLRDFINLYNNSFGSP